MPESHKIYHGKLDSHTQPAPNTPTKAANIKPGFIFYLSQNQLKLRLQF